MISEVHPKWGRPLESYARSYGLDAAKQRTTLTLDPVAEALTAINKICKVAEQTQPLDRDKAAEKVTFSVLKSASKLLVDPESYCHLEYEPLVSGCIRLMATVKPFGKPSPFSFEYGYLCFRIMTVSLGLCLLERSDNFETTIANMQSDTKTELLLVLSGHVARIIQDKIQLLSAGANECDSMIGWEDSESTIPELLSREDTKTLLVLLWEDRRLFLEVMMTTYSPGLSGVMFLLWRYLYLERTLKEHPDPKILIAPFCEIQWRYLLVATSDQDIPMIQIGNDLCNLSHVWDNSPKLANLDDTRTILHAYSGRLAPVSTRLYEPLRVTVIPLLLRLVIPHMVPGSEDLLPRLIGLIIDRLWGAFLNEDAPRSMFIECTRVVIEHFSMLIDFLHRTRVSNRHILTELVEEIVKNDFLDFVGRVMLTFKPVVVVSSEEYVRNYDFRESVQKMFEKLSKLVPPQTVEKQFRDHVPEMLNYRYHLRFLALCPPDNLLPDGENHPHTLHYGACLDTWSAIGRSVGQESNIKGLESDRIKCHYPRCSRISSLTGLDVGLCSACYEVAYCSAVCQAGDWTRGGPLSPHKDLCRRVTKAETPLDVVERLSRL